MKKLNNMRYLRISIFCAFILTLTGCERDISDDAVLSLFPKNGEVYLDNFSTGLEYLPFDGSYFEAFTVDTETFQSGTSSMRFEIPNPNNPDGGYAGAIFPDYGGRNLTDFDVLSFYAKASISAELNEVGFGLDFFEDKHSVTLTNLPITTSWNQYFIAIPNASVLTQENGLFWYAEGPENGAGYTLWFDEIEFITTGDITNPRPQIANGDDIELFAFEGETVDIPGLSQTVTLGNGQDQTVSLAQGYFSFSSSDESVAIAENGVITALNAGTTQISGFIGTTEAVGNITLEVGGAFVSAPTPTENAADVISVFSDTYQNVGVDYYNGYWAPYQVTTGGETEIAGDNVIAYSDLNFVGIQFINNVSTIDASDMTHLHIDIKVAEEIQASDYFSIILVDAGPDNMFDTGDESEGEIVLNASSLIYDEWISVDRPFIQIGGLTSRANLAQIIFVSDATIEEVLIDNIYFYAGDQVVATTPTTSAPIPTENANDVVSIFSDAYTGIGANLNPDWGQNTVVSELDIEGNNTLLYTSLNYQGTTFNSLDISDKQFIHLDYWTFNSSAVDVFLISPGPNELAFSLPVPTNGWSSIDIPLTSFSSIVDLADVFQMKVEGNGDVYFDNIYFY